VVLKAGTSFRRRLVICGGLLAFASQPARAQGALRGVVRDTTGKAVAAVDVGIVALRRLVKTDEQGRFTLAKVPAGVTEISFRRIGYEPRTVSVTIGPAEPETLVVTLKHNIALLSAVNVSKGEVRQREMIEDYYRRVVRGVGQYITRDQIEKRWGGTPSDVLRNTPGIRFIKTQNGGRGVRFPPTSIAMRDCAPMIWIDGQKAPGLEIDDITLGDIEGIEIYNGPSTTPMQFSQSQSSNNCGTIVIWSRPAQYQRAPQRTATP
jgi:hypothetical protein